ncbi:MAG: hypothetical protein A2096_03485 [Spirochaetes bacterium GWF1_41_5]|nr:MAG: hypothetical protein A2096_03485 [Spirochaetes bacterium GWF1_41_5]
MLRFIIETSELNNILNLLFKIFNVRITYFDPEGREIDTFDIKPHSSFCRRRREIKSFKNKCDICDQINLAKARLEKKIQLYTCHAGLYETAVPLYSNDDYLGAFLFGQIRPKEKNILKKSRVFSADFSSLPAFHREYVFHIAELLKYMSEYIIIKEIIRHKKNPWVESARKYIMQNLKNRITIDGIAEQTGKSRSFITHNFKKEFNLPAAAFILQSRLTAARHGIESGKKIREVAEEFGFYDEFHFSRMFRQYFGLPPSGVKVKY